MKRPLRRALRDDLERAMRAVYDQEVIDMLAEISAKQALRQHSPEKDAVAWREGARAKDCRRLRERRKRIYAYARRHSNRITR